MSKRENLKFEETLPYFGIKGHVGLYEGRDTNDFWPNRANCHNIQTDQFWFVGFRFQTRGELNHLMAGNFCLTVYLEQMGKGEFCLENNVKVVPFRSCPETYTEYLAFKPGDVEPGVYKVVATLTYKGPKGVPGPIAAFAELGMVQFYEEGPTNP